MEKELEAMLQREAARGVRLRVLAANLTEYTEHTGECSTVNVTDKEGSPVIACNCGLDALLEEVDAL